MCTKYETKSKPRPTLQLFCTTCVLQTTTYKVFSLTNKSKELLKFLIEIHPLLLQLFTAHPPTLNIEQLTDTDDVRVSTQRKALLR